MCGAVIFTLGIFCHLALCLLSSQENTVSLRSFINVEKHCVNLTFAITDLPVDLFQVLPVVNGKS